MIDDFTNKLWLFPNNLAYAFSPKRLLLSCRLIEHLGQIIKQFIGKARFDVVNFEAVMYLLGHNSLRYVLPYKQSSRARRCGATEKYIVREASTKKQEMELPEDGFEWGKDRGKVALHRKPIA